MLIIKKTRHRVFQHNLKQICKTILATQTGKKLWLLLVLRNQATKITDESVWADDSLHLFDYFRDPKNFIWIDG